MQKLVPISADRITSIGAKGGELEVVLKGPAGETVEMLFGKIGGDVESVSATIGATGTATLAIK